MKVFAHVLAQLYCHVIDYVSKPGVLGCWINGSTDGPVAVPVPRVGIVCFLIAPAPRLCNVFENPSILTRHCHAVWRRACQAVIHLNSIRLGCRSSRLRLGRYRLSFQGECYGSFVMRRL